MPDPRYRPRDYLAFPSDFGRYERVPMDRRTDFEERVRSRASLVQSKHSYTARRYASRHNLSQKQLAAALGMNYQRLSRLLNGEIVMRIDDVARFKVFFDDLEPSDDSFA